MKIECLTSRKLDSCTMYNTDNREGPYSSAMTTGMAARHSRQLISLRRCDIASATRASWQREQTLWPPRYTQRRVTPSTVQIWQLKSAILSEKISRANRYSTTSQFKYNSWVLSSFCVSIYLKYFIAFDLYNAKINHLWTAFDTQLCLFTAPVHFNLFLFIY